MWFSRPICQFIRSGAILAVACSYAAPVCAQETSPPAPQQAPKPAPKPKPYGGGTPLDVIMNTKLWVDPPDPKPFVKATRPPDDTLTYQPTAGTDVKRPKLLSTQGLKDLESELDAAGARNERAGGLKTKDFQAIDTKKSKPRKIARAKQSLATP